MPTYITHAQATKITQPQRLYDTQRGLHLWIKSATSKYWIFRYAKNGTRKDISLGAFPALKVVEARKKAQDLQSDIANGIEPRVKQHLPKATSPDSDSISFADFAKQFIANQRPSWRNSKHADQWTNTIETLANPVIGRKRLCDITTEDILRILQPIWESKTETASRLRGRLERILGAATVRHLRDGVNPAQWRGHLEFLLARPEKVKKVIHHPALPYTELPSFITELQTHDCTTAWALEFCILTATRTGEVRGAKWEEIQDDQWIIPAERMKAGKEHRVPLCERTKQLIQKARAIKSTSPYVFSFRGRKLSSAALLYVLKRMKYSSVTVHGFRSTFRDWVAEETQHSPEVAEMTLAHTIANKVESAYRRGNLLEKRRLLLRDWQDFCLGRETSSAVVRLVA